MNRARASSAMVALAMVVLAMLGALAQPVPSHAASGPSEAGSNGHDAAYARSLAESRYLDGDLEAAVDLYLEAGRIAVSPGEKAGALLNAAWLEFLLGDEAQAVTILGGALRAQPELELDARLYTPEFERAFLRARVIAVREGLERGAPAATAAQWRTLPEPPAPDPNAPQVIYARALELLESGDSRGAMPLFQRAAARALGEDAESRELRRKALLRTGWIYYQRDQWDDAASTYDQALALDRGDAESWRSLGLARLRQGEPRTAAAAFREAYALEPANPAIARNLAHALVLGELWEDAVSWISDAVRHHEADAELYLQLGRAHAGRGSTEQAEEAWRSAIRWDQDLDGAHSRSAARHLAHALFAQAEFASSAKVSRAALERDPSDTELWNLLGLAQQESGAPEDAAASFLRACELSPKRAELRNNLGSALAAVGDLAGAEEAFVLALTLEPGFATAQTNLDQVRARRR